MNETRSYRWRIPVGADTTIRLLDTPPDPFGGIQWIRVHNIVVPLDQAEDILDITPPTRGSLVKLKPHVKQWCVEALKGNLAYPRRRSNFDGTAREETVEYYVEFADDNDALHFKLRWIG